MHFQWCGGVGTGSWWGGVAGGRKGVCVAQAGWSRGWPRWEKILDGGEELCSEARRKRADRAETRVEFSGFLKLVSWGTGDEGGRRTEQGLSGRKGLDDDPSIPHTWDRSRDWANGWRVRRLAHFSVPLRSPATDDQAAKDGLVAGWRGSQSGECGQSLWEAGATGPAGTTQWACG
jgi:hypothetical protein